MIPYLLKTVIIHLLAVNQEKKNKKNQKTSALAMAKAAVYFTT